jgi:hypothetical protein
MLTLSLGQKVNMERKAESSGKYVAESGKWSRCFTRTMSNRLKMVVVKD